MSKKWEENCWYKVCERMKLKITSWYMHYSTPVNSFMTENTYIPLSCVWALKTALLYEVFQHRHVQVCKFNIIVVFDPRLLLPGCV
jgi:hypothetical protein